MAAEAAAAAAVPGAGAAAAAVVAPIAAAPPDARVRALALLGGVFDESAERVAALTQQRNQIAQDRKRVVLEIKQAAKTPEVEEEGARLVGRRSQNDHFQPRGGEGQSRGDGDVCTKAPLVDPFAPPLAHIYGHAITPYQSCRVDRLCGRAW